MARGFTLIEILVVVAIISLLALVAYASADQARKKARDDERLSSLKQMQAAIEVYGQANGRYPEAGCGRGANVWTGHGSNYGSCAVYIQGIESLISPLPVDPKSTVYGYVYRVNAAGTEYKLLSYNVLENKTLTAESENAYFPTGCSGSMTGNATRSYAVSSPGAKCW